MKIAVIVRRLNVEGGTQRQALALAREFKKAGHRVKLYTFLYSPDCYPELSRGLDVVSLGYYPKQVFSPADIFRENAVSKKLALMIDKDSDILHPHDQVAYKVAYYFKKNVKNIPSVWVMNDMPTRWWSFWRASQLNPDLKAPGYKKILWKLIDWYDISKFISAQDAITVLDERDAKWTKKFFGKEAAVMRSGLDLEKFQFAERTKRNLSKTRILMNGIFFPHRRFEDGILALKILRDKNYNAELAISGNYKSNIRYYESLCGLIKKLGVADSVKFLGHVSEDDLVRNYGEYDIFLFPNHLQSWGLAVFEAMARGMPAIVSRTAGASEVLSDGKNAVLVDPYSPEAIARAVGNFIDNSELYFKISREGRAFVENNISWPKCAERTLRLFSEKIR